MPVKIKSTLPLPVDRVLGDLKRALADGSGAVLVAPAGAGKTTRVAPALLGESWLGDRRIVMLEPRRLAARAAAAHMARGFDQPVGKTVGYRVRMDSKIRPETRIEVVTEGVLTRMIQHDPALSAYGLVIFDEFHERHLTSDFGLALCIDIRGGLREDLRLLVMSATLDPTPVADLLGGAPVIRAEGRLFPVKTRYREVPARRPVEAAVAAAVIDAADKESGDILAFLAGAREIGFAARHLEGRGLGEEWEIHQLYGAVSRDRQDRAIAPAAPGRRKVVLATNIAETSLTIEGVGVVVDSGWVRVPRFDPATAMTRLTTVRVSRASADQRRGRAGRTGPGICIRMWPETAHCSLHARSLPEILETDLAPLALELALWGVRRPDDLSWLDPPPAGAFRQAKRLLQELEALDAEGRIRPAGRRMAGLGIHPRLAHMVLRGAREGFGATACVLAGLLEERDLFDAGAGPGDADVRLRLEILSALRRPGNDPVFEASVNRGRGRRILKWADRLCRRIGIGAAGAIHPDKAGRLLALAYPDRIAMAAEGRFGRFRLSSGGGARFSGPEPLCTAPLIVAAALDGRRPDARIFLAAAYDRETLEAQYGPRIRSVEEIRFDLNSRAVVCRRRRKFGALVLDEKRLENPDAERVCCTLTGGIRRLGLDVLPWTEPIRRWRHRVLFLRRVDPEGPWPDLTDAALLDSLETWLGPYATGVFRLDDLTCRMLQNALFSLLHPKLHRELDALAPAKLTVPSGKRHPVDYAGETPVLAVKLQEMFGTRKTPSVAGGKAGVLLHLLSPAGRPVQVTRDLDGFWQTGYDSVRKELRGRYPKHPWPEDPVAARPTAGTKRRP
jgi:ATP-dependent helicase HrpB